MKVLYVLATAGCFLLAPVSAQSAAVLPWGHGLLVQVKHRTHRAHPYAVYPYVITTPEVQGSGRWRNDSDQSFGASPGQPGSPTYAPYAGLPPLRYGR
jgi:hypothetical protein